MYTQTQTHTLLVLGMQRLKLLPKLNIFKSMTPKQFHVDKERGGNGIKGEHKSLRKVSGLFWNKNVTIPKMSLFQKCHFQTSFINNTSPITGVYMKTSSQFTYFETVANRKKTHSNVCKKTRTLFTILPVWVIIVRAFTCALVCQLWPGFWIILVMCYRCKRHILVSETLIRYYAML